MIGQNIDDLYFRYDSVAGHAEGCPRRGTDVWETTRFTWYSRSDEATRQTVIRYACRQCGVVSFERVDGPMSSECTHASQVGYGSKPEKMLGVWLHPGPRIWHDDDRGPTVFFVTATKEPPRRPEDVLGKVGWNLGPRHGLRWSAGLGCPDHGSVLRGAEQTWTSRRAAVAWVIAAAEAGEHARARCETCGASGADEALEKTTWTALADGSETVRWFCRDRRACNDRRFPELPRILGENRGGAR